MAEEFVAINYIDCSEDYRDRFEYLFKTRARAIDRIPGFKRMQVLRPRKEGESYLVISHWESEDSFKAWMNSPEFIEGHKRGFEDISKAKEEGRPSPLHSKFVVYEVLTD